MKPSAYLFIIGSLLVFAGLVYTSGEHYHLRQPPRFQPSIPMTFDHRTHQDQQCVACHHNFIDASGQGLCLGCHLDPAGLSARLEEQFHALCRDCHETKQLAGEAHGPIRSCTACHQEDTEP